MTEPKARGTKHADGQHPPHMEGGCCKPLLYCVLYCFFFSRQSLPDPRAPLFLILSRKVLT